MLHISGVLITPLRLRPPNRALSTSRIPSLKQWIDGGAMHGEILAE